MEYCCTCTVPLTRSSSSQSQHTEDKRLQCCGRIVCGKCIKDNQRFARYCPYCQISSTPSCLPQGLRDPPQYSSIPDSRSKTLRISPPPPAYHEINMSTAAEETEEVKEAEDDIVHHLNHEWDSIPSLSIKYAVSTELIRQRNNIASNHLLAGRKTILIPREHYGGPSLSPMPIEDEQLEAQKTMVRRFMAITHVFEYNYALWYLEQTCFHLDAAVQAWRDDEAWVKKHPYDGDGKGRTWRERIDYWHRKSRRAPS